MRELLTALARHAIQAHGETRIGETEAQPAPNVTPVPRLRREDGRHIDPSELLEPGRRAVILAGVGQGKSMLFRHCAVLGARRFLADGAAHPVPVLVGARTLAHWAEELLPGLAQIVGEGLGRPVPATELAAPMRVGRIVLFVDGLDEIGRAALRFAAAVNYLGEQFPRLSIITSSRTTGAARSLDGFETLLLADLSDAQIWDLAYQMALATAHAEPAQAEAFVAALDADARLQTLARNPLLLQVLWLVFRNRGKLPARMWELYGDATDYLLSAVRPQMLAAPGPPISLGVWHWVLGQIALSMLARGQDAIDMGSLSALVERLLASKGLAGADPDHILQGLEAAWLLLLQPRDRVAFAHRSFQEYYAARAVAADPSSLVALEDRSEAERLWIALRDWVPDRRPLLEAATRAANWRIVARLVTTGSPDQDEVNLVVGAFESQFGKEFLDLLRSGGSHKEGARRGDADMHDVHKDLLRQWDEFCEAGLPSHEKGQRFETFAELLFGQVFKVVTRDLQTRRGELDLLLEIRELAVYWIQFGGDVLVECKNWATRRPVKEVNAFFGKVDQSRVKLAFMVSVSGFTKDAVEALRLRASNPTSALVVPVSGNEILGMLRARQDLNEFFKERIRITQHQQKL